MILPASRQAATDVAYLLRSILARQRHVSSGHLRFRTVGIADRERQVIARRKVSRMIFPCLPLFARGTACRRREEHSGDQHESEMRRMSRLLSCSPVMMTDMVSNAMSPMREAKRVPGQTAYKSLA